MTPTSSPFGSNPLAPNPIPNSYPFPSLHSALAAKPRCAHIAIVEKRKQERRSRVPSETQEIPRHRIRIQQNEPPRLTPSLHCLVSLEHYIAFWNSLSVINLESLALI
ncbi:hypothetical protein LZ31DRAFT_248180 [Colletotrichum somersetense]|nr:hypothetical protein LZ31DRAFT_248180 [Colletotrichum somersetense]